MNTEQNMSCVEVGEPQRSLEFPFTLDLRKA